MARNIAATNLLSNEQMAAHISFRPYPDARRDLHCRRIEENGEEAEIVFPDYRGVAAPLEYRGRWYWIEPEPASREGTSSESGAGIFGTQTVGALAGQTASRVVVPSRDVSGQPRECVRLYVHNGRLYLGYKENRPETSPGRRPGDGDDQRRFLVRVDAEKGIVGEPVLMPRGSAFDGVCEGGYYYGAGYRREETWRTRFDFLFSEQGSPASYYYLYRLPLPK